MKHFLDTMPVLFDAKAIRDAYYRRIGPERPQTLFLCDEDEDKRKMPLSLVATGTDCDGTWGCSAYSADFVADWLGYKHGKFVLAVPPETIDCDYPPLGAYAIVCHGRKEAEE